MENLIPSIHAALAPDATDEVKHQGALACRNILATLEPAAPSTPPPPATHPVPTAIAAMVSAYRGVPLDQLLDMAIERLRTMVPNAGPAPGTSALQFQIVPVAKPGDV